MAHARLSLLGLVGVALPLFTGCGSDPATPSESGGTAGTASQAGTGGSAGTPPEPAVCDEGPNFARDLSPEDVGTVSATLLADGITPASDVLVTVCGIDVCSRPEFSSANGEVAVSFGTPVTKPAFKYGDGLVYAEFAYLLEDAADGAELGELYLPKLPEDGAPIAAGQRSESNGVSLTLEENASTGLEDLLPPYDSADARAFRAAELPIDELPAGVDHGQDLEAVFALAPLGATLCPAAVLELPNSAGWEAGTEVEFLLQGFGVLDDQFWAPYGDWGVFASGVVSEDGAVLVTTEGGLPLISNVGVRRR